MVRSSMVKNCAKQYFFRAALCHLCMDFLNAQLALQRYGEELPSFADSREVKFVKVANPVSI